MLLTSKRRRFGGYKNSKPFLHLNFGEEAGAPPTRQDTHASSHRRSPRLLHHLPGLSAAPAQNPLQPSPPFFFPRAISAASIPLPLSSSFADSPVAKPPLDGQGL